MIGGYFDGSSPANPRPMVEIILFLPGFSITWTRVPFLLDTGATYSCLHPADAQGRLGITSQALNTSSLWTQRRTVHGIGGTNAEYIVQAQYALQRDDGTWAMHHESLGIARPTRVNQTFPSLLGWDILRHYRVVLDWPAGSVRLEPPDPVA